MAYGILEFQFKFVEFVYADAVDYYYYYYAMDSSFSLSNNSKYIGNEMEWEKEERERMSYYSNGIELNLIGSDRIGSYMYFIHYLYCESYCMHLMTFH